MISGMNQLGAVFSFEALKLTRKRKVLGVFTWTAINLVIALAPIMLGYFNLPSPETFFGWVLSDSLFGMYLVFTVCILAGDSVASEFEHKTCFITFTNPIKRSTRLLGKYLACVAVVAGALLVYYSVSSVVAYSMFGVFLPQVVVSYFYSIIFGAAALGVVFLFSSAMRGSASATVSPIFLLALAFPVISLLLQMWGFEPWFVLNYAAGIVVGVMLPAPVIHLNVFVSVAVLALYIAVTLVCSVWLLNRKELS